MVDTKKKIMDKSKVQDDDTTTIQYLCRSRELDWNGNSNMASSET